MACCGLPSWKNVVYAVPSKAGMRCLYWDSSHICRSKNRLFNELRRPIGNW